MTTVTFVLDKVVLDRFRLAVVAKHGRLRGVLRQELCEAVRFHLTKLEKEVEA